MQKNAKSRNFFLEFAYNLIEARMKEVEQHLSILFYFDSLKRFHFTAKKVKLLSRTVKCYCEHGMVISLPRQTDKVVYIRSDINSYPKRKRLLTLALQNALRNSYALSV